MINFAWPWMAIILPLPFLLVLTKKTIQPKQDDIPCTINFPKLALAKAAFANAQGISLAKWNLPLILLSIAWICLTLALMRPQYIKDIAYAKNNGYDLMLAVDLSRSMEIVDFKENGRPISRIKATKKVVSNFVQQRAGDRLGLIVFAEQAFLTIPLTLDNTSVIKMLSNLRVGMAGESTAIGDAIGIGVQNLRKRPKASRVLILLTDGDDTSSHIPPLEAAKLAKDADIKIYTIGVAYKLDENLLKKIAQMTNGSYFRVTNVDALQNVYKKIDALEKSESKQNALLVTTPLYHAFLLLALLAFSLWFVITFKQYRYANVY